MHCPYPWPIPDALVTLHGDLAAVDAGVVTVYFRLPARLARELHGDRDPGGTWLIEEAGVQLERWGVQLTIRWWSAFRRLKRRNWVLLEAKLAAAARKEFEEVCI